MLDVVGIDYLCLDYIVEINRIPGVDGMEDMIQDSWQGGGMVPTALAALGRLGARAGIIGITGNDLYGRYCEKDLIRNHVDTSNLIFDQDGTTDFCIALAERKTKGRSFITRWGTRRALRREDIPVEAVKQAKYLHLCGTMNEINIHAAEIAHRYGTRVVLDADPYAEETAENLDKIDILIASQNFYRTMFQNEDYEENCRSILARGVSDVVFTLGDRGCVGIHEGEYFQVPAYTVNVVDTTGAGDVFHGAYIYGLLKHWKGCEIARFASAVSAIKCTRIGGRSGIPDLKTVTEFLETGAIDYTEIDRRVELYQNGIAGMD